LKHVDLSQLLFVVIGRSRRFLSNAFIAAEERLNETSGRGAHPLEPILWIKLIAGLSA